MWVVFLYEFGFIIVELFILMLIFYLYCFPQLMILDFFTISSFEKIISNQWWLSGKVSTYQCRRHRFDPWIMKIPWKGNGSLFQYSCLGNPMDAGAWWATVHAVPKELDTTTKQQQQCEHTSPVTTPHSSFLQGGGGCRAVEESGRGCVLRHHCVFSSTFFIVGKYT